MWFNRRQDETNSASKSPQTFKKNTLHSIFIITINFLKTINKLLFPCFFISVYVSRLPTTSTLFMPTTHLNQTKIHFTYFSIIMPHHACKPLLIVPTTRTSYYPDATLCVCKMKCNCYGHASRLIFVTLHTTTCLCKSGVIVIIITILLSYAN